MNHKMTEGLAEKFGWKFIPAGTYVDQDLWFGYDSEPDDNDPNALGLKFVPGDTYVGVDLWFGIDADPEKGVEPNSPDGFCAVGMALSTNQNNGEGK